MKRIEVVAEAESPWGLARALEVVAKKLEETTDLSGTHEIPRQGISVAWRTLDKVTPTDLSTGSLLSEVPEAPEKLPGDPGGVFEDSQKSTEAPSDPPRNQLPDISAVDIEEAKAIVGVAGTLDELVDLEQIEIGSSRFPGGRKSVLQYIAKVRKDMESRQK